MRRRSLLTTALAAVPLATARRAAVAAPGPPVLVELFTSQGCSSCPPADAQLAAIADRPYVVALAFHVTYWDRLGWKDSLGDLRFTSRQRTAGGRVGTGGLYTPQAVVQGTLDLVGSDPRLDSLLPLVAGRTEAVWLTVAADGTAMLPVRASAGPVDLWAAAYDALHTVDIRRGENAGRTVTYRNAVRDLVELGSWNGATRTVSLPFPAWRAAGHTAAVVVAQDVRGTVLGVGRAPLGGTN